MGAPLAIRHPSEDSDKLLDGHRYRVDTRDKKKYIINRNIDRKNTRHGHLSFDTIQTNAKRKDIKRDNQGHQYVYKVDTGAK